MNQQFLLVLSSPSGGGKTTVANALVTARDDLRYSVSATTRPARPTERDGVDYHFLTRDEFERRRGAGEFLESAEYSGHLYGTLESEVDRTLAEGCNVILDIEVQGLKQVRKRRDDVVSIFILPPSAETLLDRLVKRGEKPNSDQLRARLERATIELGEAASYDYVVVNHVRTQAVADVAAILDAESRRTGRLVDLVEDLDALTGDIRAIIAKMKS